MSYVKATINKLKKLSWISIQGILLVTVWSLVTGYFRNVNRGRQPWSPVGRDLTKCS